MGKRYIDWTAGYRAVPAFFRLGISLFCLTLILLFMIPVRAWGAGIAATSMKDAETRLLTTELVKGKIRKCIQTSSDTCFVTSQWKSSTYNLVSQAGGMCNRASISMAMSYLGIDCTPVYMQQIMKGSPDTSANYVELTRRINSNRNTDISRCEQTSYSQSRLKAYFNNYNSDSTYSPVYIWGEYTRPTGVASSHAMLIIGKTSEDSDSTKYIALDPSSHSHANGHMIEIDVRNSDGTILAASPSTWYKGLKISLLIQWKENLVDSIPRIATATTAAKLYISASTGGTVKETVSQSTVLYLNAKVNNDWYRTENNLFVQAKDVSITVADASFSNDEKISAIGTVTTTDGYLKRKPFEAADHLTGGTVAKGNSVTIVGKVTNKYGNVWYVTDKGYYIYSGDVSLKEDLFPIFAGFKSTKATQRHKEPYSDSDTVGTSIKAGQTVVVTKFVKNSYGNIWAQLDDGYGGYICFYDATSGAVNLEFLNAAQKTTVAGIPESSSVPGVPKGARDPGTSCGLRGKITTVVPMLTVTARVRNAKGNIISTPKAITAKPNYTLRTFQINAAMTNRDGTTTNINNQMAFGQLKTVGAYRYEVAVQFGFVYDGKTFTFGNEEIVISSQFTVGDTEEVFGETLGPTPTPQPGYFTTSGLKGPSGVITQGAAAPLSGTVSVVDGAKYLTFLEVNVNRKLDDLKEDIAFVIEEDLNDVRPTSFNLANLSKKINTSGFVPGQYNIHLIVAYKGGNDELYWDATETFSTFEVVLSQTPGGTQIGTGTVLKGDVNEDGSIDLGDLMRLLKYLSGWNVEISTKNAEVTGDGNIDLGDLTRLLKFLSGWDVKLGDDGIQYV